MEKTSLPLLATFPLSTDEQKRKKRKKTTKMRLVLLLLFSTFIEQGAAFMGKRGARPPPYASNNPPRPQSRPPNAFFSSINHPDSANQLLLIEQGKKEECPERNPFETAAVFLSVVNVALLVALITVAAMGDSTVALESSRGAGPTNIHGAGTRPEIITLQEKRPDHEILTEDLSWQVDASAGFYFF